MFFVVLLLVYNCTYLGSEAKLMSSTKLFSPSKLDDDKFELTDDYIQQTIKVRVLQFKNIGIRQKREEYGSKLGAFIGTILLAITITCLKLNFLGSVRKW